MAQVSEITSKLDVKNQFLIFGIRSVFQFLSYPVLQKASYLQKFTDIWFGSSFNSTFWNIDLYGLIWLFKKVFNQFQRSHELFASTLLFIFQKNCLL